MGKAGNKMFKLFKKTKQVEADDQLYMPVNGKLIDLVEVEDPVFSRKMMGEGFGVVPDDGHLVSPAAGQVTMVADTKHAIGLKMANGLEVLIHLGIDTVELKGAPFSLTVKTGDIIKGGEKLGSMNIGEIKKAGKGSTVIVVVTNSKDALEQIHVSKGNKAAGEAVGLLTVR